MTKMNREIFDRTFTILAANEKYVKLSFYTFIISKMRVQITDQIPTAGAGFYNNVYNLLINPTFFKSLTIDERIAVLVHECQHVILNHIHRKGERNHKLFNLAADIAINQLIDNIPKEGFFPKTFDFPKNLSAEQYYELLLEEQKNQEKEKEEFEESNESGDEESNESGDEESNESGDEESNESGDEESGKESECDSQGSGKSGWKPANGHPDITGDEEQTLDSHELWEKMSEEDAELARETMEKIVDGAVSMAKGNLPANIENIFDILKKKAKLSWKKILKRFVSSKKGSKINTIKRRSRRLPNRMDIKGKKTFYETPEIVVGVDTSGSMDDSDIYKGLVEISEVAKLSNSNLKLVQIDTEIKGLEEFNPSKKEFKRKGYGGTDMSAMARFLKDKKIQYDVLVMISDLYIEDVATHPDWKLKKPTLWLNTSGADVSWESRKHIVYNISDT